MYTVRGWPEVGVVGLRVGTSLPVTKNNIPRLPYFINPENTEGEVHQVNNATTTPQHKHY